MNNIYEEVLNFKKEFRSTVAFRTKAHSAVAQKHLNPDEKVLFAFCGQKNESSWKVINSCVVVLTNKRIIIAQKRLNKDKWRNQRTIQ